VTARRRWLRAGLALLTAIQTVVGAWAYLFPRLFYDHAPTVRLGTYGPPFNEHFVSDTGGLYLATAVVLGSAAMYMDRRLIGTALTAYLVFSVTHLIFHLRHLSGIPGLDSVLLPTGLVFQIVIAGALVVLAAYSANEDRNSGRTEEIDVARTDSDGSDLGVT
jgi:hypothetical protein